ncbi:RNA polymerase sigma factor region1.1 domain-containing protein [Microvirga solisilvae]|uniref:RNA polymerase sigma factor region1.1 domain-containing protein n=1 Tax=Microvirga solisilvae TaxID=2919498 RepID=UPI001FAEEF4E|nr:RNA polymerase sigma factor region1.1 domain-containing protein [Microvirga solisilvae]
MQPALDSTILDRLISQGRERGYLTTEDLRVNLPVENMSAEDIALVVVQLEETGIAVDLEERLLSPASRPMPPQQRSAEIIPFPGSRTAWEKSRTKPLQPASPAEPEQRSAVEEGDPFSKWIIIAGGGVTFAFFTLLIFATAG